MSQDEIIAAASNEERARHEAGHAILAAALFGAEFVTVVAVGLNGRSESGCIARAWHGSIEYARRVGPPLTTPRDGIARVATGVRAFGAFFYAGIAGQFIENDLNEIGRASPTETVARRALWFSQLDRDFFVRGTRKMKLPSKRWTSRRESYWHEDAYALARDTLLHHREHLESFKDELLAKERLKGEALSRALERVERVGTSNFQDPGSSVPPSVGSSRHPGSA